MAQMFVAEVLERLLALEAVSLNRNLFSLAASPSAIPKELSSQEKFERERGGSGSPPSL